MSTSIQIPQDVIEDILQFLDGEIDKTTLQACALTSHMLLRTSQQLLFSIVRLSNSLRVDNLHAICTSKIEIPSFIRELHLTMSSLEEDGGSKLPAVLGILNNLQSLVLGSSDLFVGWNSFVSILEPSIVRLLNLPSLQGVTLNSIAFLLDTLPPILTGTKNLTLIDVHFYSPPRNQVVISSNTHLESLHLISSISQQWGPWPFFDTPNLRELVIERAPNSGDVNSQIWDHVLEAVIRAGKKSLKHIIYTNDIEYYMYGDFWVAQSLQRLSFGVNTIDNRSQAWRIIPSILHLAPNLEELEIGYAVEKWHPINHLQPDQDNPIWSTLDRILEELPHLHTFKYYVHYNPSVTEEEVSSMLRIKLPLFSTKGMVSAKFVYDCGGPVNYKGHIPGRIYKN